ncbi:MAG: potassium/proton antiporter [Paludibacteraceae bacterium]|nr:potassium/proton antiporter [Paludibacteraceae bacterium]
MQVELILLVLSLLFFASIFTDRIGNKFGVPALLLFLVVGMVFGPDGLGSWISEDGVGYISSLSLDSVQAISTVALCVILFSGGMDTKIADIRPVMGPGVTLATIGVLLTALFSGILIYLIFGWINALVSVGFTTALLMASTMSSTDSASVFSILRTNNIGLKHNLRPLLEIESGANDPMAYVLTITLIGIVTAGEAKEISALTIAQEIVVQLIVGAVMGFALGKAAVSLMRKAKLTNESLYPIMILTFCIFIFSVTYYMKGNSYLAVYMGGLMIGNSKFVRKRQTKSFFDGLTWLCQLLMFLLLGLMVKPHELMQWEVWLPCLIISFVMIFISRPLAVTICLQPFKEFQSRDKVLVSWVGLKGAVPIIFAILCMANNVPHANLLFNVVFLCTIISLILQGTSLSALARSLHLTQEVEQKKRLQYFDIELPEEVEEYAQEMVVTKEMLQNGTMLKEMGIPESVRIIMTRRGENFLVPNGKTNLKEGDKLLVITEDNMAKVQQDQQDEEDYNLNEWRLQIITNTGDFLRNQWHRITQGSDKTEKA